MYSTDIFLTLYFQAKFEISFLEEKLSKKSWISWILEFFGFCKDKVYRENLVSFYAWEVSSFFSFSVIFIVFVDLQLVQIKDLLVEKKAIWEGELASLEESEEILHNEREKCLEDISQLEKSMDLAKKNYFQVCISF